MVRRREQPVPGGAQFLAGVGEGDHAGVARPPPTEDVLAGLGNGEDVLQRMLGPIPPEESLDEHLAQEIVVPGLEGTEVGPAHTSDHGRGGKGWTLEWAGA